MAARNRMSITKDRVLMAVTKGSRVYKCIGLFRSCLTNAKSYNVDHIGASYWPRRGRIIDIDDH
jgi:hypothetical protein